jgi:AcrR family transcriptional regulator
MPKVVDPVERRHDVAQAVWRVIRRDGLAEASVRNIAREAGLSTGSLRNSFGTQSELLSFAMRLVIDRIDARVAALEPQKDPRRRAEEVLAELVPMDDERRAENEVWLAFTAAAMVDPELRALREAGHQALHAGCAALIGELAEAGLAGPNIELETVRLHCLVDGLAVQAATAPTRTTPELMRAVIAVHLDALRATAH